MSKLILKSKKFFIPSLLLLALGLILLALTNTHRFTLSAQPGQTTEPTPTLSISKQNLPSHSSHSTLPTEQDDSVITSPSTTHTTAHATEGATSLEIQMQELIQTTISTIPTIEDLEKISGEQLHFTPPSLIEAGGAIGEVFEQIIEHPELKEQGVQFFEKCAKTANYPGIIRSLCYSHLQELIPERYNSETQDPEIPEEIRSLANRHRE